MAQKVRSDSAIHFYVWKIVSFCIKIENKCLFPIIKLPCCSMADPGVSVYYLANFSPKLHENEETLGHRGRMSLARPGSATVVVIWHKLIK